MTTHRTRRLRLSTAIGLILTATLVFAQDPIAWSARAIDNTDVAVPVEGRPSVLLFVMAGQERSAKAIDQVHALLNQRDDTQVIAVVSGEAAQIKARVAFQDRPWRWPVVADPDYAASGKFAVHVWPTTVVIAPDGKQVAHIAGLPPSLTTDLEDYLAFAAGRIDQATLERALASHQVVASEPEHIADRYLKMAQRLLDQGQVEMARAQIQKGLEASPDNLPLKLAMSHVLLVKNEPESALELLEGVETAAGTSWQVGALRGRALVALGCWDEALATLTGALHLNPEPAQVRYYLGRVHEHLSNPAAAAENYRAAFEATTDARKLGVTPRR